MLMKYCLYLQSKQQCHADSINYFLEFGFSSSLMTMNQSMFMWNFRAPMPKYKYLLKLCS